MKNYFFLLLLAGFIASCKRSTNNNFNTKESKFLDKNWDRIRIPDGGQVQAVAGDIDDTLLVSTLYNTYLLTNKGTTFTLTSTHLNNTSGLYVNGDTIYALSGDSFDANFEKHFAAIPSYYTLNKGGSWHPTHKPSFYMQNGIVNTKENVTIQLNYHKGADKNGNGDNFVLKTTISKIKNGIKTVLEYPITKEQPINLYLDQKERLYIPTGGYFSEAGVYISPLVVSPAYLYISKEPI